MLLPSLAGGWLVLPQSGGWEGCLLKEAPASVRLLADFEFTATAWRQTPKTRGSWTIEVNLLLSAVGYIFMFLCPYNGNRHVKAVNCVLS